MLTIIAQERHGQESPLKLFVQSVERFSERWSHAGR